MKLIAESDYDNQVIMGLSAFLTDIGVDVTGYRREDAIAATFWSSEDISMELAAIDLMTKYDKEAFLWSIEDSLRSAMIIAGFNEIKHRLEKVPKSKVTLQHRQAR